MSVKYDIVATTGEYTTNTGDVKKRYKNVGKVMENDNGMYLLLDKTFNPAGVPSDSDAIFLSCFEPKRKEGYAAPTSNAGNLDDEIPFN